MVIATRPDMIEAFRMIAGIQSKDGIPANIANIIQPVIDINPLNVRILDSITALNRSTTGTLTVFTAPTDKDTFITGIYAAVNINSACDVATGFLNVLLTPKGMASTAVVSFPVITLTAQYDTKYVLFKVPIKIERGSTITFPGTFTAGVMLRQCTIFGYQTSEAP